MRVTAHAHPNIALIKYWGKAPGPGNVPATPSLSITLDTLTTTTEVTAATADAFHLDDRQIEDAKVAACLANLRRSYSIPPLSIRSSNNFPTAAGLASSASGFAALVTAIDALCELGLPAGVRSALARQASGSAARSVFGGFVALDAPDWQGRPLLNASQWPLKVVIAITDTASKAVSSSVGMQRSAETSPYYPAWVETTPADFAAAVAILERRDFTALAEIAEHSCLKMHGLMLATQPGLLYWNATTLACLHSVRALRAAGESVFFTVDAGPQVKAVCLPASEAAVRQALERVTGVSQVLSVGLGQGAWVAGS
ncbi:MAG: diphosphomevalonate decarboxylase [Pseudomonadales bacterium]